MQATATKIQRRRRPGEPASDSDRATDRTAASQRGQLGDHYAGGPAVRLRPETGTGMTVDAAGLGFEREAEATGERIADGRPAGELTAISAGRAGGQRQADEESDGAQDREGPQRQEEPGVDAASAPAVGEEETAQRQPADEAGEAGGPEAASAPAVGDEEMAQRRQGDEADDTALIPKTGDEETAERQSEDGAGMAEEAEAVEVPTGEGPGGAAGVGQRRAEDDSEAAGAGGRPSGGTGKDRRLPVGRVDPQLAGRVERLRGGGAPLPPAERRFFEPRFGRDLSSVRIHTDAEAAATAAALKARAYTVGDDVVFARGRYRPGTREGRRLLAHELTHVIQQSGGNTRGVGSGRWAVTRRPAERREALAEARPDEAASGAPGGNLRLAPPEHPAEQQASAVEQGGPAPANALRAPAEADTIYRHRVAPTPVARLTRLGLFGDGTAANPGKTLEEFEAYSRRQADWFSEATLTATDRDDLWRLLLKTRIGPHVLAGAGDLRLTALRGLAAGSWPALLAFGRGIHPGSSTVRIVSRGPHNLNQRLALGTTIMLLETLLPGEVLEVTVAEQQLLDITTGRLFPQVAAYWSTFQPHLQQSYVRGAGARAPEFQNVLDLVTGPGSITPFLPLWGKVRDLHRFPRAMLTRLVANFADTSRRRPFYLVLHTGHDERAFQQSASLYERLVASASNLVLVLEGQASLAAITAQIPSLTATYGQLDAAGRPRIAQALISGHGQARSVELAGTGAPTVSGGQVTYPSESLDLDRNAAATNNLLTTLLGHLNPATARVVYAGCLVGSNPVPLGTAAAAVPGHIAAHPSLGTFTENLGVGMGLSPGFVQAARASVGLSAATSLTDAAGNLAIQYGFDPAAFGPAPRYVAVGHEPEGVMVAAVEVAAASPVAAETLLRARSAVSASSWWDEATLALVATALAGVAPRSGVSVTRLNELAHMAQIFFLARFSTSYSIRVAHFTGRVNPLAPAAAVYTRIVATPTMATPPDVRAQIGRFVLEQGWLANGGARAAALITFLDGASPLTAGTLHSHLDTAAIAARSPALFPVGAAATPGRIRLALAWLRRDPANANVRAFLNAQVAGTPPALSAAVTAQLGGQNATEVLEALGRLTPTAPVPTRGGTVLLPLANVDVTGRGTNQVRVEPRPHEATVRPHALRVRSRPSMSGRIFAWLSHGASVRVIGFTHGWAAIDHNGRLGFVYGTWLSPPPP